MIQNNLPTLPTTLAEELECNIFLKAEDLETFSKLRDLKDNFSLFSLTKTGLRLYCVS